MPSQINNPGNIGYNTSQSVSANYLRTTPSTRFSTRQLQFFEVTLSGVETGFDATDSLFSKAVRGVQVAAEVYAIGIPSSNKFMVVVADDTANNGADSDIDGEYSNAKGQTIANAIDSSTGGSSTVTRKLMVGGAFASGRTAYAQESAGI